MNHFYFDASALAKRYTPETGSDLIDEILDNVPLTRLMALIIGALEVFWICVRKRNDGRITPSQFSQATRFLNQEVIADDSDFELLPTPDALLQTAMDLVERHSINGTDALVLCSALETATRLRNIGDGLVLVAADQRLLRAARAEGLTVFNPETDSQQALIALIGS
jgi:uncharacterized protein